MFQLIRIAILGIHIFASSPCLAFLPITQVDFVSISSPQPFWNSLPRLFGMRFRYLIPGPKAAFPFEVSKSASPRASSLWPYKNKTHLSTAYLYWTAFGRPPLVQSSSTFFLVFFASQFGKTLILLLHPPQLSFALLRPQVFFRVRI